MLNILITGANGQLGRSLQRLGGVSPHNYICTDVAELDITDAGAVLRAVREHRIDVIVNCAAYTDVEKAEEAEARADLLNHKAAGNLAAAAKETGATLFHVSTDYVFDGTAHTPYTEDVTPSPLGAYGRTKLAGERAVMASGCRYLIFRTAWLYSEYGKNFLKTMLCLSSERERLQVVFDQIGTPTYTYDLARLLVDMIESEKYGYYHATNEGGYIEVAIKSDSEKMIFSVKNSGKGISREEAGKVFERFYKTDKSRSYDVKGAGLGLYIVKTIIDMHGGQITVNSEPGEYTQFVFWLPLR